ncbi:MAG: nucleotidyltransferase family protein [Ruminococcus sp.]|nr:nucleotidyltransferase family protein [Ruminococcus sp.]
MKKLRLSSIDETLLEILAYALFGNQKPLIYLEQIEPLLREARLQSVYPLVYSSMEKDIKEKLDSSEYAKYDKLYLKYIMSCAQNFEEHNELDGVLQEAQIPYCVIKGVASAAYYTQPFLRSVGDVDFLIKHVHKEDVSALIKKIGFEAKKTDNDEVHVAFSRGDYSIWEMHYSINGIPENDVGELIREDLENIIYTSNEFKSVDVKCSVPNKYYHGLILLLHTASHLTHEGIGLRHLCDWAVYVNSFEDNEFESMFKEKLTSYGLWTFAQILTELCVRYLGVKPKCWSSEIIKHGDFSCEVFLSLILDVLSAGNFGKKDVNRYREIKYIHNSAGTVDKKGIFLQAYRNLNRKVFDNHKIINRVKILLPIGWMIEGIKYINLLLKNDRKNIRTISMISQASKRKRIYSKMNLFQN